MAVSNYKLENNDSLNMWNKCENNVNMWTKCETCETYMLNMHFKKCEKCISTMWKHVKNVKKCEQMWKHVEKQEITCFNTFPILNQQ